LEKTNFIPEKLRLIDEKGEQVGVLSKQEALSLAEEKDLDLLLVSREANPPVFKLGDLGKLKYFEEKKKRKQQKLSKKNEEKVIKIKFNVGIHDLKTKANHVEKFLEQGKKVRVFLWLRGREKQYFQESRSKLTDFLDLVNVEVKYIKEITKLPGGYEVIITKKN
jgi:translation initiation factor IF-3